MTQAPRHRGLGPTGMVEPRPGLARRSPGREAGSRGVTLSRSLCTPGTSGHPVRATLVQPGTGVSPAPRKGAAGERPACAPCQLPGRQRQRARPSEDTRRGPAVAVIAAAGPGRWLPARRGSGRGGRKHQHPRPAPAPGVTTQVPLWGWRHDGTSTQGWWHHCPPHGCLRAGGCRRAGQVTCLVSENTSLVGDTETSCLHQLQPRPSCPPQVRESASRPPASRSGSTALWFRGAATRDPQRAAGHGQPGVGPAPGHGHRETRARPGHAGAARPWSCGVTRCAGRVPRGPEPG